jgi:amino acid permease
MDSALQVFGITVLVVGILMLVVVWRLTVAVRLLLTEINIYAQREYDATFRDITTSLEKEMNRTFNTVNIVPPDTDRKN